MSAPLSAASGSSLNQKPIKSEHKPSLSQFDAGHGDDYIKHEPIRKSHVKHEPHIKRHHDEAGPSHVPTSHQRHAEFPGQQRVKDEEEKPYLSGIREDAVKQIDDYLGKIEERYPDTPEMYDEFVALKYSCASVTHALPHVSRLFGRAPDLVREFLNLRHAFNAYWFRQHSPMADDPPVPRSESPGPQEKADIQNLLSLPEIDIPEDHRKQTPPAMSCKLLEHQKVCLTWLMRQEQDPHKKGGLLADTMGLGKTVEALALILARPSRDPACKTTLIVSPVALLRQWEREIEAKVKPRFRLKTLILHGPAKRNMTVSKLLSYDVVITTYGKITSEHRYLVNRHAGKKLLLLASDARFHRVILDEAHYIKNRRSPRSFAVHRLKASYRLCMTGTPLMNNIEEIFPILQFLRIAPYDKWLPFHHSIAKPLKRWNEDVRSEAMRKFRVLLRSIMLRRTRDSILDGEKIVTLPPLSVEVSAAEFDEDQQKFYTALESKQQIEFNKYLKAGLNKHYAHILVLLLRLRQVCCHPHLIKDLGLPDGAQLSPEEMFDLALKLRAPVVERIKSQGEFLCPRCYTETENPVINYPCGHHVCPSCFTGMMEIKHSNANSLEDEWEQCPHSGCTSTVKPDQIICYDFFTQAYGDDVAQRESDSDEDIDSNSDDDADERGNLKGFVISEDEESEEDLSEGASDNESAASHAAPQSQKLGKRLMSLEDDTRTGVAQDPEPTRETAGYDSDDSLPSLEELQRRVFGDALLARSRAARNDTNRLESEQRDKSQSTTTPSAKRKRSADDDAHEPRKKPKRSGKSIVRQGKGKVKGPKSFGDVKRNASRNFAAKIKYRENLRKNFVSSAKIDKMMELLRDIREQDPNAKTIVFSLWTSFLDLVEISVHDEGFRYRRYDGSMPPRERDAAVQAFMDRPEVGVFLVSLMAGNAGLNLTAATNVIILEPFWNPFVEDQAIDRAHRIGQKHPVTVHRVLIAGTVEDRIQELQEKKRRLVNAALDEEGAQSTGRLSVSELRGLFGIR